jgi:hypothetical protein
MSGINTEALVNTDLFSIFSELPGTYNPEVIILLNDEKDLFPLNDIDAICFINILL